MCQIDTTVGDFVENVEKVCEIVTKEKNSEYDIFIFPELTITGYPPLDLLDKKTFIEEQNQGLQTILDKTKDNNALIILGCVEFNKGSGRKLFNTAIVCHKGEIIYRYHKRLLPTYDVFDEARYFEPGKNAGIFYYMDKRIGLLICEDLWYDNKIYNINPVQELFEANVNLIISINASPSVVGKFEEKLEMIANISKKYGTPIVYVNQVGGNDDIVFDGNSFATNKRGDVVIQLPAFEENIHGIREDLIEVHPVGLLFKTKKPKYFKSDAEFFYKQAICGIRSYIKKTGFKNIVIGESGGIDSAVVTALAADALGGENVIGITMPSEYSSEGSYKDSELLCKNFGTKFYTYPIKDAFTTLVNPFNDIFGVPDKKGLMEENLQARIRGQILMAYSNRYGAMVFSTGNKSEMSVGYFTIYGDACGGMAPISDLYKMEVYAVARYINEIHEKEMIPIAIINKEPSAELAPDQRDTDSLPPYPILDVMLKFAIEGDTIDSTEKGAYIEVLHNNYNAFIKVKKLIKNAEFKRRQVAITIKMHEKAFGYGRLIPISQKWGI